MNIRRWAVAGLAACAALALATGCSGTKNGDTGQTTVTQSPTPAPKDALAASVRELQKSSFSFMMKDAESEARGSVDPGAKNAQVKATFTGAQSGMSLKMEILPTPRPT